MKKYLAWNNTDQVCPRVAEIAPHPSKQFSQSLLDCGTAFGATTSPCSTTAAVGLPVLPDYILAAAFASHSQLLAPPSSAPTQQQQQQQQQHPRGGTSPVLVYTAATAAAAAENTALTASQLLVATNRRVNAQDVTSPNAAAVAAAAQQLQQQVVAAQQGQTSDATTMCVQLSGTAPAGTSNNTITASALSNALAQHHGTAHSTCAQPSSQHPFLGTSLNSTPSATQPFVHPSAFSVVNAVACSSASQTDSSITSTPSLHSSAHAQLSQPSPKQTHLHSGRAILEQVVQPARPQPLIQSVNIEPARSQQTTQQVAGVHSQHMSPAAAAAALYPQLMCLPVLLDRFGPHILRSHMSPAQFKPIPNNERVDLARFRAKEPQDWSMEDVIAWMLDVAKRNRIPFEDLEMQKFASCTGPLLLLMTEQNFKDRDPNYGSLLFSEFRKLVTEESFIDDWMRAYKDSEDEPQPSTSRVFDPARLSASNVYNFSSAASASLSPSVLLQQQQTTGGTQQQPAASPLPNPPTTKVQIGPSSSSDFDSPACSEDAVLHGVNMKIRKNKDGKPRKRSQHTKGNKLWEFIRDALKDPSTCPSVVRWEDPIEGVFRIVESEKLARLWGEKKNNQKMTYEKLSRAMRTYYEKQILVPVPKTGLYPKKLVYKFGPSAHGWDTPLTVKMEHCA
uniref:ETSous factor n=1 Tax=Ascaris suum TaxID=6253 RepID=F1KTA1_ASCSU